MQRSLRFAVLFCTVMGASAVGAGPRFHISFPIERSRAPIDGRMLLLLSTDGSAEPRMQISNTPLTQMIFGMDVDALAPGHAAVVEAGAWGYPVQSLAQVKPGEYFVQAVLHRYETFHRADGHVVKLPMDRGEGQHWNLAPGNLYSKPRKITIGSHHSQPLEISLSEESPPIPAPPDTKYIRHLRIQSELLTKFWGRPMFLGANVLVPEGFDAHPDARYPLALFHGHFPADISNFRPEPPEANLKPDYSERFHVAGYNHIQQQEAYQFYQQWIAPNFPRFLVVEVQHANPYYDDSYAVNSANLGPYGDAIETELMPAVEKQFRSIGQGWARFLYGGSTGGWEALAVQMFYPDHYNGAFVACPDPVDFRAFTTVNIYEDKNAYVIAGPHKQVEQPAMRDFLGHVTATQRDANYYELALGTRSRSGEQYDIWQAVFSPVGDDGYPREMWDKKTGEIHKDVAEYWREHYDLRYLLQRDWFKLGPKLEGKIHVYVGTGDNYFLDGAVHYLEDFLKTVPYGGEVKYGDRAEHCWNGDPNLPNHLSRMRYNTLYLPKMLQRMESTAPPGADLKSWRY